MDGQTDLKSKEDAGMGSSSRPGAGTPRWVKVFGIILVILVLLFIVTLLIGGGHGPARHTASAGPGGYTQSMGQGVQQP
jgi:hypothetical protein